MWPARHAGIPPPPVNRMTDRCKIITLPQTSFAGGNNYLHIPLCIKQVGSKLGCNAKLIWSTSVVVALTQTLSVNRPLQVYNVSTS